MIYDVELDEAGGFSLPFPLVVLFDHFMFDVLIASQNSREFQCHGRME